jgi:hypothetical protein
MRALKMPWKQLREENNPDSEFISLDSCVVVMKSLNVIREDFEFIQPIDDENDKISWIQKSKVIGIFEVYPDLDAFNRRTIPIQIFRHDFMIEDTRADYEKILWADLQSKKDNVQDFSKGELINVD